MLDQDPIKWYSRIQQAEKLRDSVISHQATMIQQYHGKAYQVGDEPNENWPENHWQEWLNNIRPQVVFSNPEVSASTRRSGVDSRVPQSLEAALNWWTDSVNLWRELDRCFVDSAFTYGVMMTYYAPYPGFEGRLANDEAVPFRPNARRVAPHRWFCDHDCDSYLEARFAGHVWRSDKESLVNDPRFNSQRVAELPTGAGWGDVWRMPDAQTTNETGSPHDDQVMCYDIWVPELDLTDEEGANGAILTLGVTFDGNGDPSDPEWIRDPYPFYGPRWGPYTLFGYHIVPNNPYPLSPFTAVYEQIEQLNEHATALARSASRYRKNVVVDAKNDEAARKIQESEDGQVLTVSDLAESVQEITMAGADSAQFQYVQWLRDQRDRRTGLTENTRGNVNEDATATAVSQAASQEQTRIGMLKRLFTDCTERVLNTAAYYYYTEPNAVMSLPKDVAEQFVPRPTMLPDENRADEIAVKTGMPPDRVRDALTWNPEIVFAGGPADQVLTRVSRAQQNEQPRYVVSPNVPSVEFDDLMLEIEPYSMEQTNEALLQKQRMELVDRVTQLAPLMAKQPQLLRYDNILDMLGEAMNERNFSERVIPEQLLRQIKQAGESGNQQQLQQLLQQLAQMQGQGEPQQGQPQGPGQASMNQPQPAQAQAQMQGNLAGQGAAGVM